MPIIMLDTPVEITMSGSTGWQDYDLDSYISGLGSDVTGVLIRRYTNGSTNAAFGSRKNGSTLDASANTSSATHAYYAVGVDSNHVFELYQGATSRFTCTIVGYFTDGWVFLTTSVDKSTSTTDAWVDCDIGSYGAVGALFQPYSALAQVTQLGLRKNGSTSTISYFYSYWNNRGIVFVGLDANEVCEQKVDSIRQQIHLIGYCTSDAGLTILTDPTDYSISTTGAWTDLSALPTGASVCLFQIRNDGGTSGASAGLRPNGSSDEPYSGMWGTNPAVKAASGVIEGKISNAMMDFYLLAYEIAAIDYSISSAGSSYSITGAAASLLAAFKASAASGTLTLTGQVVALKIALRLVMASSSYSISGQTAALKAAIKIAVATNSYAVAGQLVDLYYGRLLAAATGSLSIAGSNLNLLKEISLACADSSYSITGQEAATKAAIKSAVAAGDYSLAGQLISLTRGYTLSSDSNSYEVSGLSAGLFSVLSAALAAGNYTLAGQVVNLIATTNGESLAIAASGGTYSIAGKTAAFHIAGKIINEIVDQYVIAGQAVSLKMGYMTQLLAGLHSLTGSSITTSAGRTVTVEAGTYSLAGTEAIAKAAYRFLAGQDIHLITGQDADLLISLLINVGPGEYVLTGEALGLFPGKHMSAESGLYSITGQDISFHSTWIISGQAGAYLLVGATAGLDKGRWSMAEVVELESAIHVLISSNSKTVKRLMQDSPAIKRLILESGVRSRLIDESEV